MSGFRLNFKLESIACAVQQSVGSFFGTPIDNRNQTFPGLTSFLLVFSLEFLHVVQLICAARSLNPHLDDLTIWGQRNVKKKKDWLRTIDEYQKSIRYLWWQFLLVERDFFMLLQKRYEQ